MCKQYLNSTTRLSLQIGRSSKGIVVLSPSLQLIASTIDSIKFKVTTSYAEYREQRETYHCQIVG